MSARHACSTSCTSSGVSNPVFPALDGRGLRECRATLDTPLLLAPSAPDEVISCVVDDVAEPLWSFDTVFELDEFDMLVEYDKVEG